MQRFPELLKPLATAYSNLLSSGEPNRRLAHHFAHVASEAWLALEFAFLVNADNSTLGLEGWTAFLERAYVDVTLMPPDDITARKIHLEFKLVPPSYWRSNWNEVYRDLRCHPQSAPKQNKPVADYAVCFLIHVVSASASKQRNDTSRRYQEWIELIPETAGKFAPILNLPPLWLAHSSPSFRVQWPYPIRGKWPQGYDAFVRILWVTACQ